MKHTGPDAVIVLARANDGVHSKIACISIASYAVGRDVDIQPADGSSLPSISSVKVSLCYQ